MLKKVNIILMIFFSPIFIFADKGIAPYVLDGSLLIYFPSIKQTSSSFRILTQKMFGAEYQSSLSKLQLRIKEHVSVNILDPLEAPLIGLDPEGAVAYVHLKNNKGYSVFTIKNKNLLTQRLNSLSHRVYYKIVEDKYVIFSSSLEVLEYEKFKGVGITVAFQRIAKAVDFNWDQKFVWATSEYFSERHIDGIDRSFIPQGDFVGGVFDITEKNIMFNLYTIYQNKLISDIFKKSMDVAAFDSMSFLDFESGIPAIVGHLYLDIDQFVQGLQQIDIADEFTLTKLLMDFKAIGLDLHSNLFPYLSGRLSYVVRHFDLVNKKINATLTAQIKNKDMVRQFLMNFVRSLSAKGVKVEEKTLFTQSMFGFSFGSYKLWLGIVENHFVFSTDEASVIKLIQNVYNAKKGFLTKELFSFTDFLRKKRVGGQTRIVISQFLNNIPVYQGIFPFFFISTINDIWWTYSFNDEGEELGRRDTIILNFI
ncbi:MAG: hypothetical protein ACRCTJ_00865 [Brevinema sp.]